MFTTSPADAFVFTYASACMIADNVPSPFEPITSMQRYLHLMQCLARHNYIQCADDSRNMSSMSIIIVS